MLMPGIYQATIKSASLTTSRAGTPCVMLSTIVHDDLGGDVEMVGYIYLSQKAAQMARQQLKALGFDPDTQDLELIERGALDDATTQVKVVEDNYGGTARLKINRYGARGKPTPESIATAQNALRAAKAKPKDTPTEKDENDDIPF